MPITVNNFGKFKGDLGKEMKRRITRSAIVVSREAKKLISTPGTGKRAKSGRGKRKGSTRYGLLRSKPGAPPLKQTGRLRSSVAHEVVSDDMARVGTNVDYGKFLELGTRKMAARPWLVRSLDAMRPAIAAILTKPWKA